MRSIRLIGIDDALRRVVEEAPDSFAGTCGASLGEREKTTGTSCSQSRARNASRVCSDSSNRCTTSRARRGWHEASTWRRERTTEVARPRAAGARDIVPVLRGRALEIVDDHGAVRASITVFPADPTVKMPDGTTGCTETVLLRLRDSKGQPNVKIAATELGGGLLLGGESDPTYVQILAERANTS